MKQISRLLLGFITGLTGVLALTGLLHFNLLGKDAAPVVKVENTPVNRDIRPVTSFAPVVKKAAPSVVNIYSSRIVHERSMRNPLLNDPVFRQFFGGQLPEEDQSRSRREESLGSGVIVSPDGYILTANHVVEGADEIKVAINSSKKELTAKVIGRDKLTDVAVLKIEAKDLSAITLADSDQLEVGDIVLAIGNPFGVGQTVTMGIISALGRNGFGFSGYENFIQTDAAINPGNSGGALVDAEGRLVGINTAIISRSGDNSGIGFAVPINLARHVMERLIAGGRVARGYLGIYPQDLTPDLAQQFNIPNSTGALVGDVYPDTPAQKAGIKSGDVILSINGKDIADAHSLTLTVSELAPGSTATLGILREDGSPKTITLVLGEHPGSGRMESQNNSDNQSSVTDSLDGVTVEDLDADIRQQLRIPDSIKGVIVAEVAEDSNAAEASLAKGDVIMEINHQPVSNTEEATRLCKEAKGDHILLKVWHREGEMALTRFLSVDNTKRTK
jgi:serine protease Do